jgi:CheY-like chemotaxis protein
VEESRRILDGLHVLVVDDDADARHLLRTVLVYHGAIVATAATVDAALRAIRRVKPDVLVCDTSMPGKDGYALLRAVRALPEPQSTLPAIALTAFRHEHPAEQTAGFQAHLTKPVDLQRLCEAVERLGRGPA